MPARERPPTGTALDKSLDNAFGSEEEAAAAIERIMNDPARHQLMVMPPDQYPATLNEALARFQAEIPSVRKGDEAEVKGVTKDGRPFTYTYRYADLADVTEAAMPPLGRLGLSWSCLPTMNPDGRFVLKYVLAHVSGEERTGEWPISLDKDPQTMGSAITYLRRYAFCAVTGIAPGGDDEDGARAAQQARTQPGSLDESSMTALPPDEAERIMAALEPAALTPLAEYPKLWQIVVARRAAGKESPVEHGDTPLTWGQLFGFSLAQRVDRLRTPTECRDFWDEAKAVEVSGAKLPWQWQGQTCAARVRAHGKEIATVQESAAVRLRALIADTQTIEEIHDLHRSIDLAHEEWKIHNPLVNELHALADARQEAITKPKPAGAPAEPAQDGPAPHPLGFGRAAIMLEYRIWAGAPTTTLGADLDGALERGEIDTEEERMLRAMLRGRPEPTSEGEGLVPWLEWKIDTASGHQQLDQVSAGVVDLASAGKLTTGAADAQSQLLYNRITARRKVQDGQRYGSGS